MGTWGTGLYSDDTARDVRDAYRDLLGDGNSELGATEAIISRWSAELADPDVAPVFWLALADTQWKLGHLQDSVRTEALLAIDGGSDLEHWKPEGSRNYRDRQAVLVKLRERLAGAQPPARKVRKRYRYSTDWKIGEVYAYRLNSGRQALFHVVGHHEDAGGRGPVCVLLDWQGEGVPDVSLLASLGHRNGLPPRSHICEFLLASLGPRGFPKKRVELIAQAVEPKLAREGYTAIVWEAVDTRLEQLFGVS